MSIDVRTRLAKDVRELERDEILDALLPESVGTHGDLAGRGLDYQALPPLGLDVRDRSVTLASSRGQLVMRPGLGGADVVAVLDADALSDLVQDMVSAMGLAMTSRVSVARGSINDWIRWEPVLRALLDGRPVHEAGDITFVDLAGDPLDLDRSFTVDDDRDEMRNFLEEAGFLHLRATFDAAEAAALGAEIDHWVALATPDDGDSWWATTETGEDVPVRVLNFADKSETLRRLMADDRLEWLERLTGDGHVYGGGGEGLVKPLGIVRGLSDLPWHKDCGQGRHSYRCSGLTCGISVTGADRLSGALGVVPGSHRANTMASGRDPRLDLPARMLRTRTGDVTVHCSDTLHRAHPPVERSRKVVYTDFTLPPLPGDVPRVTDPVAARAQRAGLSDVQGRIEASDNAAAPDHYSAGRGH